MAPLPSSTDQLATARAILSALGTQFEDGGYQVGDTKLPIVVIKHGVRGIILAADPAPLLRLVYAIDFDEKDGKLFLSVPDDQRTRFFHGLRRELLEGRSAYRLTFDDNKNPTRLIEVSIEQRLVITDESSATIQRFLDGMQELVTLGVRAEQILLGALRGLSVAGSSSGTTSSVAPDGMYH